MWNSVHQLLKSNNRNGSPVLKLWIVLQYAVSPDMPESTRQWELASILNLFGWSTTVVATGFNHKQRRYDRPVSLSRPLVSRDEQGVEFIWLYSTPYADNGWRRYANMISFLLVSVVAGVSRSAPSIVIGTYPNPLAGLAGWILAKRHRVPFVLEVQDLWPQSLVEPGLSNTVVIRILEMLERFLYRKADHIVVLTEGIRSRVEAKGTASNKVTLISNAAPFPSTVLPEQRRETRQQLGCNGEIIAILIGAHGQANGLDVLVDAAKNLKNEPIRLVLVGDGVQKPRLQRAAAGLKNITYLDAVPKSEVSTLLAAADIALIVHRNTPAVRGARPNKLFDYMAAGLPILLNLDGEARGLVEAAGAGLFAEPESPNAIAAGLRTLSAHQLRREEMGRGGLANVISQHSREARADGLDGVLKKMLPNVALGVNEA